MVIRDHPMSKKKKKTKTKKKEEEEKEVRRGGKGIEAPTTPRMDQEKRLTWTRIEKRNVREKERGSPGSNEGGLRYKHCVTVISKECSD